MSRVWFVQWPDWEIAGDGMSGAAIGCVVRARSEDGARKAAARKAREFADRAADQRVMAGVDEVRRVDPAFCDISATYVLELKLPALGLFAAVDPSDLDHPLWSPRQGAEVGDEA